MLIEGSGYADSLALTTRQVDALSPKEKKGHDLIALQESLSSHLLDCELSGIEAWLCPSLCPPLTVQREGTCICSLNSVGSGAYNLQVFDESSYRC